MQMVIRQDRVLQLIPFKLGLEYLQLLHKVSTIVVPNSDVSREVTVIILSSGMEHASTRHSEQEILVLIKMDGPVTVHAGQQMHRQV